MTPQQIEFVQQLYRKIPGSTPISTAEAEVLLGHHSDLLRDVARDLSRIEELLPSFRAARALTLMGGLKLHPDYTEVLLLIDTHGWEAVRTKLSEAREHPAAREVLKTWLATLGNDDSAAPVPQAEARNDRAPIHDTPLAPPGTGSMKASTPPPARSMLPANRGQGEQPIGRPPQSENQPQRGNVHPLPSRSQRVAQEEAYGDAPAQEPSARVFNDDKAEVYTKGGRGAALRFQNSVDTRKDTERHVVFVELAPISPDGGSYQWRDRKLTLMLNDAEVEQVILVLLGHLQMARFSAHGADKKKWFQIANQSPDDKFAGRVQVQAGNGKNDENILLNIFPQDVTRVTSVLLRGYKAMRNVSEEFAVTMLRSAARNYSLYAAANAQGGGQQGAGRGAGAHQYRAASG